MIIIAFNNTNGINKSYTVFQLELKSKKGLHKIWEMNSCINDIACFMIDWKSSTKVLQKFIIIKN